MAASSGIKYSLQGLYPGEVNERQLRKPKFFEQVSARCSLLLNVIESIGARISKGKFPNLDGHVGETRCQIRALKMCEGPYRTKIIQDTLTVYQSVIGQMESLPTKADELLQLTGHKEGYMPLPDSVIYSAALRILYLMRQVDDKGRSSANKTRILAYFPEFSESSLGKKFFGHLRLFSQRFIAQDSVDFVRASGRHQALEDDCLSDMSGIKSLPFFATNTVLMQRAQRSRVPFVFVVRSEGSSAQITCLLFECDSKTGEYKLSKSAKAAHCIRDKDCDCLYLCIQERKDFTVDKPVMVFEGISTGESSDELYGQSPIKTILLCSATHSQSMDPKQALPKDSKCEAFFKAGSKGYSLADPSTFLIQHCFSATINLGGESG